MNKTKDSITRSYKKKNYSRTKSTISPFLLHAYTHTHLYLIHQTIRADVSHAQKEDEFAPNGVKQFDRGCESSREQIRLRIPVRDGPRATRPTYTKTIYIYSFLREDQRFKAVGASRSRSRSSSF